MDKMIQCKLKIAKELKVNELLSPNLCVKRGGHYWNNFDGNTPVNALGKKTEGVGRYCMAGVSNYRICGMCGTRQRLIPASWENEKNIELEDLKKILKEERND